MVWYGMVWYGMVWYGTVRYGMVWYGTVWYGIHEEGFGGIVQLEGDHISPGPDRTTHSTSVIRTMHSTSV